MAPVRGQARDGTDVYVLEDARLVEEEGLDAARGAEVGWGFVGDGVKGLGGDRRVDVGDDLVQTDGLVGDGDPVAAAAMEVLRARKLKRESTATSVSRRTSPAPSIRSGARVAGICRPTGP